MRTRYNRSFALMTLTALVAAPFAVLPATAGISPQERTSGEWIAWNDMTARGNLCAGSVDEKVKNKKYLIGMGTCGGRGEYVSIVSKNCSKVRYGVSHDDFNSSNSTDPGYVKVYGDGDLLRSVKVKSGTERNFVTELVDVKKTKFAFVYDHDTVVPYTGGPDFYCS